MSDHVSRRNAEMRQELSGVRRPASHEALGRSSCSRALPVAATPIVNLLNACEGRGAHERKERVCDPRAVYEQHRVARSVHDVFDLAAVNRCALHL